MTAVKIYEFDSNGVKEWVAAHSEDDAKKVMNENFAPEDMPPCRQLTEVEMDTLKHTGEDGEDRANPLTFRQRLTEYVEQGCKFPMAFATTEI